MSSPLRSLIECGTKLWLDSIDPDLVASNRALGASGATSNPIIISGLIETGRFDGDLDKLLQRERATKKSPGKRPISWSARRSRSFLPVWQQTRGNDGYVSFELDPLLEDLKQGPPHAARVARYIELGKKWASGHQNRMIKVPATPAGLDALEELVAAGVTVNVTLIFSMRQYEAARDAVWRGAQRRKNLDQLQERLQHFRVALRRLHREGPAAALAGRARAWWASSTPSGFGWQIRSSGATKGRRWRRR